MVTSLTPAVADERASPPVVTPRRRGRRPPRPRRPVVAVAASVTALAVVLATASLVRSELATRDATAAAIAARHADGRELHREVAELAVVRQNLAAQRHQVAADSATIAGQAAQLSVIAGQLDRAVATTSHEASNALSLTACLGGVEAALNSLSVGDTATAFASLGAVRTSCQSAANG